MVCSIKRVEKQICLALLTVIILVIWMIEKVLQDMHLCWAQGLFHGHQRNNQLSLYLQLKQSLWLQQHVPVKLFG